MRLSVVFEKLEEDKQNYEEDTQKTQMSSVIPISF